MISINKKFLFFNLFWALLPAQDDPFVLDSALTDSLSQSLANTIIAADMNNDNINDVFSFDDWMFKEIVVEIFNRWGKQVYHWSGAGGYWDGKNYNDEKLPEGVYFYSMTAKGMDGYPFQEKGSVTLFR